MPARKQITKKLRFDIFKRDSFTCQYCGKTPPNIVLEIDHIIPVSKKGTNSIDNLITSCFDCNRGKSNGMLQDLPKSLKHKHDLLIEKETQLKEYQKLIRRIEKNINKNIDSIDEIYNDWFPSYSLSDKFKRTSVKKFLELIPLNKVSDAMNQACSKINDPDNSIKYFCGICWKIIKGESYE